MRSSRAFTLIELLVVIAIIAVLMGVLMPALRFAREQSRRVACGHNEKSQGLALFTYAHDYDGKLPLNTVERWLFDVSYYTVDMLQGSGMLKERKVFYCPSWPQRNKPCFWRYGEYLAYDAAEHDPGQSPAPTTDAQRKNYHRIMGYFWIFDTVAGRTNKIRQYRGEHKEWVKSVVDTKAAPASIEMITDVVASNADDRNANFAEATGGCWGRWQVFDRSNHIRNADRCTGGNILFLDGHASWRKFEDMKSRYWNANPTFWW